jgi:hypothetical protein
LNIEGIFFDNMSTDPSTSDYYLNLGVLAKGPSFNFQKTIGNPGTTLMADSLIVTMDTVIIYESWGIPTLSLPTAYPKTQWSVLAHSLTSGTMLSPDDATKLRVAAAQVGYIYATDDCFLGANPTRCDSDTFCSACKAKPECASGGCNDAWNVLPTFLNDVFDKIQN